MKPDQPYYQWLDDLSLDLYTERSYFPNNPERMESYYSKAYKNDELILLGIFDNSTNEHIGNITFQNINWINRNAIIAYLLGNASFAGKGIMTDAVLMMLYYGFNKLNFERIGSGVSELHNASKRVLEKSGMKIEGKLRNYLLRNGEFSDVLILSAIRKEWMDEFGEKVLDIFLEKPTY
jgi:[ribosomal protein S5]-alanine N-acetyltransferase